MSQHTVITWKIVEVDERAAFDNGFLVWDKVGNSPTKNPVKREQARRLIAAAPDLLAALKVCLRNCEAHLYMLPVDASEQKDILSCEIGNIKAAIRRADEGGEGDAGA